MGPFCKRSPCPWELYTALCSMNPKHTDQQSYLHRNCFSWHSDHWRVFLRSRKLNRFQSSLDPRSWLVPPLPNTENLPLPFGHAVGNVRFPLRLGDAFSWPLWCEGAFPVLSGHSASASQKSVLGHFALFLLSCPLLFTFIRKSWHILDLNTLSSVHCKCSLLDCGPLILSKVSFCQARRQIRAHPWKNPSPVTVREAMVPPNTSTWGASLDQSWEFPVFFSWSSACLE